MDTLRGYFKKSFKRNLVNAFKGGSRIKGLFIEVIYVTKPERYFIAGIPLTLMFVILI